MDLEPVTVPPAPLVWVALFLGVLLLPGAPKGPQPPPVPWMGLLRLGATAFLLVLCAPLCARWGGPALARRRGLSFAGALPPFLWGMGLLLAWPAAWGEPGGVALVSLATVGFLPWEVLWLAHALPEERPIPAVYGVEATARGRRLALRRLLRPWLTARLPVWGAATLVLERVLGVPGLGMDLVARVGLRHRFGLAVWVGVLALLSRLGGR